MKKTVFFFGLFILFCYGSCKEDPPAPVEPSLPSITQTGENTFGCTINGELWLPQGGGMTPAYSVEYSDKCVMIRVNRVGENPITSLTLDFGRVYADTTFVISNYSDTTSYQYFLYSLGYIPTGPSFDYVAEIPDAGEMHLARLDTLNRIVSGTFFFKGVDSASGDTLSIQNGRFDFHY